MSHCLNAATGCVMWGFGGVKQCNCACDVCSAPAAKVKTKRVCELRPGDRIAYDGIQTVKRVDFQSKDDYIVRLRNHKPLYARWDAQVIMAEDSGEVQEGQDNHPGPEAT